MIKGDDVTAKAESFGLREDNRLKADFQDSDLATFCHKAGTGYPSSLRQLPRKSSSYLPPHITVILAFQQWSR